jgi:hypothetical protein
MRSHTIKNLSGGVWGFVLFAVGASSACGPNDPWPPGDPDSQCATDADCEAARSVCETVTCVKGQCELAPAAAGTVCDDGRFCSVGEVCDGRGACGPGSSFCRELVPGIPRCNEAEQMCEICTDGRPLVNGECRCPFWNCLARGGATWCSETDVSEENTVGCWYDGLTVDDLPPLLDEDGQVL